MQIYIHKAHCIMIYKQLSTKNMSKHNSNQALLVLFPSKKHPDEKDWRNYQEDLIRAERLKEFCFYTMEEEAEEYLNGVCTKLKLYEDPWTIKKVLEGSDVKTSCRLTISKRLVKQHIVKVWERAGRFEDVRRLEEGNGVVVKVWDCDRGKEFRLTMKKHVYSTNCYIFCANWKNEFVNARGLKKGDEIGLVWCNSSSKFYFSVLARAPDIESPGAIC